MANNNETAKIDVILNGQKANATLKEMEAAARQLNAELRQLPVNSKEFVNKTAEFGKGKTRIAEINNEIKNTGLSMKNMGDGLFGSLKNAALKFGAAAAAAFSLNAIKDYVKGGIESAMKLRDTESLLLEELNGQKSVQADLIKLATERSGSTKFGRLEIEEAEKFLAIQQRTPEQIKKTIVAATNLAALTGGSLNDAVKDLDGTMEGRLGKGLGKLEKDFKGLTKEQMYNGEAIDIVAKKYAGLAEREMNTTEGRVILLEKAWKALQRTVGELVIGPGGMFSGAIDGATSLLNVFKKFIEIPVSEKIKQERDDLNSLVFQIQATNTNQAERNRLLNELRIKYPEFLGNLSNEQATNEKLAISLSNVNQQYVEKIRLANSEEKLKDLAEVQEKASRKLSNAEQDRNVILSRSMELLYQANSMAAKLVEQAPTLDAKIELVKKYFGSIGGTGEAFLAAAQKAKAASLRMTEARQEFMDESLKIAEDGVRSSLNLTNTLDGVSNQILNVALRTKDETLKAIIQAEIADRESQQRIIANKLKSEKEKLDLTKLTEAQLNEIISRAREDSATNIDRTNSRLAQKELNRREGLANAYEQYMDLMREIADLEKTNFADKLSQTEQEIRAVNDKYNNEIKKIEEFKRHNKATLTPEKTKSLDTETGKLEIERDKQTKQILEQAEVSFADKVKLIHENLRVARMTITNREVYEINKKYDELQKEILDAIEYRYRQEISQANGNKDKIIEAEKNKAAAIVEIQAGVSDLNKARKEETDKAIKDGDIRFEEDLKGLKLKSDTELAKGKEKIQLELNQKYKKLLDENIGDEKRAKEIKAQMDSEQAAQENALATEKFKKMLSDAIQVAQAIVSSLSNVASAWEGYQNAILQQEAAADEQKKSSLKKQLDDKIISQQQYDTAVGKIDAEADKKKRKIAHDQAVVGKATAVANAIINTAVAITSVLSIPILGELLAVVVGVLGAAQVALILATPIPEAAKGRYAAIKARQAARGRYNVTGQDDGKLFRDVPYEQSFTGIPGRPLLVNETGDEIVIDPETTKKIQKESPWIFDEIQRARVVQHADGKYDVIGQDDGKTYKDVPFKGKPQTGVYSKPALISEEGQELIIDAETTKKIQRESPWIIDEIQRARVVQHADGNDPDWLYPSQQKRFTPALKSEKGPEPIVNVPTVINMQLNYPKLMQAINYSRVPQYAFGKDQQPTSTPSTSEPVIVRPVIVDKEFTDAIKTFNENAKKGFKSVIVYDDIWKESDKINRIQNDASSNR